MKQAEDKATRELPGLGSPTKRGRGRPRIDNPLTPAERAKRYRNRKKKALRLAAWIGFRDPMTGATWSGRGQMPVWARLKLKEGVDLAEYWVGPK